MIMNTNVIAMSFVFSLIAAAINLCAYHVSSFSQTLMMRSQPSTLPSSSSFHHSHSPSILYRCRPSHCSTLYSSKSNEELIKTLLNDNTSDDTDPYSRYTHQIAIPLSDASELHSALHAIQTSLVRDCPRLIRACIMPALLRMPLLYVDGSSLESGNVIGSSTTDSSVDTIIEEVVYKAIREVVYGEDRDVVEPIMLPFQGLELQGDDNSVLYVVGSNVNVKKKPRKKKQSIFIDDDDEENDDDDGVIIVDDWSDLTNAGGPSGWEILEELLYKIQHDLENKHGLQTCWPLDSAQVEVDFDDDDPLLVAVKQKQKKWRPRVPFVRLPIDFYQELKADSERKKKNEDDEDNDEKELSFVDKGFDGISPLFWYEAWGEDEILPKPGVRMQSVAVYRRMMSGGGESEASFYVPTSSSSGPQSWKRGAADGGKSSNISLDLPAGDATLRARERREAAKANERLGEVEQRAEEEWEEGKAKLMKDLDGDLDLLAGDDLAQFDVGMETGEVTVEGDAAYTSPWVEETEDLDNKSSTAPYSDVIDVDVDALIENIARPSAESSDSSTVKDQPRSEKVPAQPATKPRDLPSIEDNPVFQRLWKGKSQITANGQNTALTLDGTPPSSDESLPPYPSDAHFVGAWRIVSFNDDTDSQASDNFILRVDGQVSGGVSTVLRLSLPL